MDKSTKPDFLREARLQDCLAFLDKLRKSGVTNMFDVRQMLREAFPDLTTKQTGEVVNKLKAAAALSGGQSIQKYVIQLLLDHVAELERKGQLPKGPR